MTANCVPAAAVIRGSQALSGVTGCKEYVGGFLSCFLKPLAYREKRKQYWETRVFFRVIGINGGVVKCVDTIKNTSGEGGLLEDN